jgi:hypothetical protein
VNPLLSLFTWLVLAVIGLVGVVRSLRWRGSAARLARATRGDAFVHGVVEADAPPVTIETDQHRSKAGIWEQTAVRARLAPFHLRRPGGYIVRVEPDANVALLWSPDQTRAERPLDRVRIAQLAPGAAIDILGTLTPAAATDGAPYRDGATATLTPPRHGPMLISKIPLRTQYARMAAYQVSRIGPVFGLWLLLHTLIRRLWHADLALLGVASAPTWVAVLVGTAGVIIAAVTRDGAPPWSTGSLDEGKK